MYSERFNKAYNALVDAYFNGTLAPGTCSACAVGNIVAAGMGVTASMDFSERFSSPNAYWAGLLQFDWNIQGVPDTEVRQFREMADRVFMHTGYSSKQLGEIENAFEWNTKINLSAYEDGVFSEEQILEDQFNGLQAVMDVLISLEGITDGQPLKDKFREHPKLQVA